MNDKDLVNLAADCQRIARAMGALQNVGEIELPPSSAVLWLRRWRLTRWFVRPQQAVTLTTKQVTEITNALLSAGNYLAFSVSTKKDK